MYVNVPVLVIGPVATPGDVADLHAYAFDVCDQTGAPAVVATHNGYDVRHFSAVYVYGPTLSDGVSLDPVAVVLMAEAIAYGVDLVEPQPLILDADCEACGQRQTLTTVRDAGTSEVFCLDCRGEAPGCAWCLEDDETAPILVDGAWVPLCHPCGKRMGSEIRGGNAPHFAV
ncbi:hypothetical protein BGM19_07850 [Streptomyces agglomeratus]|uniref:hypothetical protein n=1 Tax=Streptomyces agglomeratus TaxID=285458 RepID=UPI00086CEE9E|nr:hypothetical protein [Streptomyces agglomeratus]OEJ57891.1 hypothetical protein BGM19_07850 [Streptomyces agglomeratus]